MNRTQLVLDLIIRMADAGKEIAVILLPADWFYQLASEVNMPTMDGTIEIDGVKVRSGGSALVIEFSGGSY